MNFSPLPGCAGAAPAGAPAAARQGSTLAARDLVNLGALMKLTGGDPELGIGLVDGPVARTHPDLATGNILEIGGTCTSSGSLACRHGTFVAGILSARRESAAPAICPGCRLIVRPIFSEAPAAPDLVPSATPEELARAIVDCVGAGVRLVNVSAALTPAGWGRAERTLTQALDHAANREVLVVVASGNEGTVGSTAITRHPWVVAVAACDRRGRPLRESNLGRSIGHRGLRAPGESITSLRAEGGAMVSGGTSVAAPFVTGAIALAWSQFPGARAGQIRFALSRAHPQWPPTVVPPLLDAWAIYETLSQSRPRRARG